MLIGFYFRLKSCLLYITVFWRCVALSCGENKRTANLAQRYERTQPTPIYRFHQMIVRMLLSEGFLSPLKRRGLKQSQSSWYKVTTYTIKTNVETKCLWWFLTLNFALLLTGNQLLVKPCCHLPSCQSNTADVLSLEAFRSLSEQPSLFTRNT